MNERQAMAHMVVAHVYAELSYAKRRKVGCIVVKDDSIIGIGYNGTPPGWTNNCENHDLSSTLPEVIHAEQNALDKIMRGTISSVGAEVFVTTAPCIECAKRLFGAKVRCVYYSEIYRSDEGLTFLRRAGIKIKQIKV